MKRLVLVGGGHAHLSVLEALAARRPQGVEVTLITPAPQQNYSGMLPGWIADHYSKTACQIDLRPLVAAAQGQLVVDSVVGMDAARRCVGGNSRLRLPKELIQITLSQRIRERSLNSRDTAYTRLMKAQTMESNTAHEPGEMTRREEIMEIAAKLFVEKGYKATTVRLIAEAANVQSGSLYHHFGSKDDIVDELLGKYVQRRYEDVVAITATGNPKEQLQKLIESAMGLVRSHRAALLLLQQDGPWLAEQPRFSYLNEAGAKIETLWRKTVKSGIDAGVFNPEIDPIVPYYIVRDSVLSGARWFNPRGKWTIERWTQQCVILILSGLCTPSNVSKV